ncbi:MAG: hypothetical protein HRU26_08385, partial [Psychroserpens sp.]|nr:hypothetical protein [Psychroserpens sp.]
PGMLYAANAQNEERMLQTFGMLAVELRGSNGEDLNLAEGSSAEIRVPLDPSLVGNAPGTIPLWYFDEDNGYWIEDGQATLVGNEYVGTVTHFSFWNCDVPADVVTLCVNVVYEGGGSVTNQYVAIQSASFGTRGGYTNGSGTVCGLVPQNDNLTLRLTDLEACQGFFYEEEIGSLSEDTTLTITIPISSDLISESIIGAFETCSGNPVTDGYVRLKFEGNASYNFISDGTFEFNMIRCEDSEDTFQIYAADYINIQETDSINYTFTTPLTNIGTIVSCNDVDEFITYQYGDDPPVNYNFDIGAGILQDGISVSVANADNSFFNLYLANATVPGSYTNGNITFFDENGSSSLESQFIGTMNLTSIGEVGEYIDINFSGEINDWNNPDNILITGTIHVLRDN